MVINSLFEKAKSKRLASLVDLTSPEAFKRGIEKAKTNGFSLAESRAFNLGQTRAKLQLRRTNLSTKERIEFQKISKIKLPKVRG